MSDQTLIDMTALEIEPDTGQVADVEIPAGLVPVPIVSVERVQETPAISEVLPPDFPLYTLLRFLPNVKAKHELADLVAEAQAIDLKAADGLQRAEAMRERIKDKVESIRADFKEATGLAHTLWSRLTGLRADFVGGAETYLERSLGPAIIAEERRRNSEAEEQRRAVQKAADEAAREAAARAVASARERSAPAEVVEQLERRAETVTAPPVPMRPAPGLKSSGVQENFVARLVGTAADGDPNPAMNELSPEQQASVRQLMGAVLAGKEPLTCFDINWKSLNAKAKNEKTTFAMAGVEAFDKGKLASKPGRRR